MIKPLAFSPGSISCFFRIVENDDPSLTVSKGCAVTIREGVTASVEESDLFEIVLNGRPVRLPTVQTVVQELTHRPLRIFLESPLPIGCGFGFSAAAALSAAFALNRTLNLGKSRDQLAALCHQAEVQHKTGIGDVAAQLAGGVLFRRCQEGVFDTIRLPHRPAPLYCTVFGPIETREILGDATRMATIATAGDLALASFKKPTAVSWEALLEISRKFAEESGLMREEVRDGLRQVEAIGGKGCMVMLGNALLSTIPLVPSPLGERAKGEGGCLESWQTTVDFEGTRLL